MSLRFFPLRKILRDTDGSAHCDCSMSCEQVGKHPAVVGWADGTYWNKRSVGDGEIGEGGGWGIPTGSLNGIFVVDLDVRAACGDKPAKDGVAALEALARAAGGEIPDTLTVLTPSGGVHLYFTIPLGVTIKSSGGSLGPGIDVRGEGGYVVGPNSPHKSGGFYKTFEEEMDHPAAFPPQWLLEKVVAPKKSSAELDAPVLQDRTGEDLEKYIGRARNYLAKVEPCIEDGTSSKKLGKYAAHIRSKGIPLDRCLALLQEFNQRCTPPWLDSDLVRIINNVERGPIIAKAAREAKAADHLFNGGGIFGHTRGSSVPLDRGTESAESGESRESDVGAESDERADTAENSPPRDLSLDRKAHDPDHRYSFYPGDLSGFDGATILRPDRVVADLYRHNQWDGVLQYDEFADRIHAVDPPLQLDAEDDGGLSDRDVERIKIWFNAHGLTVGLDTVRAAIELAACRRSFHPVKDYLDSLPPATTACHELLNTFASKAFGNDEPMANEMFKKTMVAAVRRILVPGTQVDTMLVLKGDEGLFKSRTIRALFSDRFFKDQLPDLKDDARASHSLLGFWGIESGELDKFLRADNTTAKAFLSRSEDSYHAPYGHRDVRRKRQCIFIGTTNADDFLTDATGNRRYWIVVVYREVDVNWVRSVRDSLWSAALELAKDYTYPHWFHDAAGEAAASRAPHEYRDPWHEVIEDYCAGREKVTWGEVYTKAVARGVNDAMAKVSRREMYRVCAVLKRLGCRQRDSRSDEGIRWYGWLVPEGLSTKAPSLEEQARRKTGSTVAQLGKMRSIGGANA